MLFFHNHIAHSNWVTRWCSISPSSVLIPLLTSLNAQAEVVEGLAVCFRYGPKDFAEGNEISDLQEKLVSARTSSVGDPNSVRSYTKSVQSVTHFSQRELNKPHKPEKVLNQYPPVITWKDLVRVLYKPLGRNDWRYPWLYNLNLLFHLSQSVH